MGFGSTPTTVTQGALATNQVPLGEVYVPNHAGGNATALQGGPSSTDSLGNESAPVAAYTPDGNDVTQGASTDANTVNSIMGRLTKIRDLLLATLVVSGTITEANSASINTHLANVDTATADLVADLDTLITNTTGLGTQTTLAAILAKLVASPALETGHLASIDTHTPALGQALAGSSVPVVLTAAQQTALTPPAAIAGFALEAGHLAAIDTSTAASKTDLDTIVTNTNKIPASPAQEAGNLATLVTQTLTPNVSDRWARQVGQIDLARVLGAALSNSNPVPSQDIEQSGYTAATSPPTVTNAGSDTSYTFSSQVSRIILENHTSANVYYAFDAAASAGSLKLVPGATLIYPKKVTVVHLFTAAAQNVNGTADGNIVVLGAN